MTRSRNARHMLAALRTADRRVLFGGITLTAMVVLAIIVPLFAPASTGSIGDVIATRLVPPLGRDALGHWHLLGTDAFGRDLFVRLWVGARISLAVAVAGSALSGVIGIALGAVAGWRAGWFDRVISAAGDALLAIPRLVLLLVIAALWGPGLWVVIVVLGLTGWMAVMRLVRAEVQQVRQQSYVEGADALGCRRGGYSPGMCCPMPWGAPRWRSRWVWAMPSCSRVVCRSSVWVCSHPQPVGAT